MLPKVFIWNVPVLKLKSCQIMNVLLLVLISWFNEPKEEEEKKTTYWPQTFELQCILYSYLFYCCVCVALFTARFCGQCAVDQHCGVWDCQCAAPAGGCSQAQQHCTGTHLVSLGQQHWRYTPTQQHKKYSHYFIICAYSLF